MTENVVDETTPLVRTSKATSCRYNNSIVMGLREWLKDIAVVVYILVMLFAMSSWIDINGLWVEMPLLVNELPEGWNLPSYLVIIIQFANVGPLTYTIINRISPNRVKEWPVVYIIISIGAIACLLLVFFWSETTVIAGEERSTALLTLASFLALVDCTSSVVYLPYMAAFKLQYMSSYYVGEGLSGLVPAIIGLFQGTMGDPDCQNQSRIVINETAGVNYTEYEIVAVYAPPRFSVEVFFFILFLMLCISGCAFTCIHFMPYCKKEHIFSEFSYLVENSQDVTGSTDIVGNFSKDNPACTVTTVKSVDGTVEASNINLTDDPATRMIHRRDDDGKDPNKESLTLSKMIYILVVIGFVNALTNGVIPSTQTYSAMPYGNRAYSLTVRLSTIANPLACFIALFIPTSSLIVIGIHTFLGTAMSAYQIYLAAVSPYPPLQDDPWGEVLVVLTAILLTGFFSYVKVCGASILRDSGGRKGLLWCGGVTQVGSCIGAISIFIVINIMQLFESAPACPV